MTSPPTPPDAPPSSPGPTAPNLPKSRSWGERIKHWIVSSPKLHAVIIGALALALVGLAIAHLVAIDRVRDAAAQEHAALVESTTQTLNNETSALLRMSALPLAWALRSALLKDDFASADAYVQRMTQEKHVKAVALVTADGKVRLAGNRKLEGHPAAEAFPGVDLNGSAPAVSPVDHNLRVVVPVMGIDRRLGTLIFSYAAAPSPEPSGSTSG